MDGVWRRRLAALFKLAVAAGLLWVLYRQLIVQQDVTALWRGLRHQLTAAPRWPLLVAVALAPLNIALEGAKYRRLLPPAQRPGLAAASRTVCAGLAAGIFTPNRVGEYLGRLAGARPGQRTGVVAATLLGGVAQWVPLVFGGLVGQAWFWASDTPRLALVGGTGVVILVGFLRVDLVLRALARLLHALPQGGGWGARLLRRAERQADALATFAATHRADLAAALALASARYAVYLAQITLTFLYFGLAAPAAVAVAGVAAILLAQTLLPVPAVLQALARVELASLLWADYAPNELALTAASLLIFVLNLGLPALLGLSFILRADVAKALET